MRVWEKSIEDLGSMSIRIHLCEDKRSWEWTSRRTEKKTSLGLRTEKLVVLSGITVTLGARRGYQLLELESQVAVRTKMGAIPWRQEFSW